MLDDDTRELISDYYLTDDDGTVDITYGRKVRGEYFCEDAMKSGRYPSDDDIERAVGGYRIYSDDE